MASDACRILGLHNTTNAVRPLKPDEQSNINRIKVGMAAGAPALIISESGLYKLIMRSDKAEARNVSGRGGSDYPSLSEG